MSIKKFALLLPPLAFVSCTAPVQNQASQQNSTQTDPNNPYAVPGVSTQGSYAPAAQAPYQAPAVNAPYQALPNVPVNPPASIPSYTPPATAISTPSSSASSHTVSSGDTLWGLSQKYGVSVDDIRQANGLSGTIIATGQTLNIPR